MSTRKEYIIQFVGLGIGAHEFEFDINDKFFEGLDYSEIKQGQILIDLNLLKQYTMMVLNFKISGTIKQDCDRCTVRKLKMNSPPPEGPATLDLRSGYHSSSFSCGALSGVSGFSWN